MRPRRKAGAVSRELPDGETVVMGSDGARALILNPMGAVVWGLCEGSHDLEEIAALICEELADAEPDRVRSDVAALVDQLVEAGVLEVADADAP